MIVKIYSLYGNLVSSIEYENYKKELTIYFNNSTYGVYFGVPNHVVNSFLESPNQDSFYSANFRNRYHEIIIEERK